MCVHSTAENPSLRRPGLLYELVDFLLGCKKHLRRNSLRSVRFIQHITEQQREAGARLSTASFRSCWLTHSYLLTWVGPDRAAPGIYLSLCMMNDSCMQLDTLGEPPVKLCLLATRVQTRCWEPTFSVIGFILRPVFSFLRHTCKVGSCASLEFQSEFFAQNILIFLCQMNMLDSRILIDGHATQRRL